MNYNLSEHSNYCKYLEQQDWSKAFYALMFYSYSTVMGGGGGGAGMHDGYLIIQSVASVGLYL